MKPDESIRKICIKAINKWVGLSNDFVLSRFLDNGTWQCVGNGIPDLFDIDEKELPIALVFVDHNNFTVVTTRQIITRIDGVIKAMKPDAAINLNTHDFQNWREIIKAEHPYTMGKVGLPGQQVFELFIETGGGAYVMIYAVRTLVSQWLWEAKKDAVS